MIIYMYATRDEARTKGRQRTYGDGPNFSSIQQTASPRRHVVRTKASRVARDVGRQVSRWHAFAASASEGGPPV